MIRQMLLLAALASAPAWASETEWVAAKVVKVDAARGRITLDHAPIKSLDMAAMTMGFKVADSGLLSTRKVGERVRFLVTMRDDELVVVRIEPSS